MSPETLRNLVFTLVPMILSLSVHEWAHAWVAHKLGDDTAQREDRLTLSPLSHIDPIGTLLIPTVGILFGGFGMFGWARPVPVNPQNLTRKLSMRVGMAVVAAAGPVSNLAFAIVSVAALGIAARFGVLHAKSPASELLFRLLFVNVSLFVFNLLPVPPLDGSRLLPRSLDGYVEFASRYSFLLLLVVLNVPFIVRPMLALMGLIEDGLMAIFLP